MTVLPAIERELRAQARLPFTYGLRVLGAASLLLVSLFFDLNSRPSPNQGGALFGWLNFSLFLSIWIIVPLIAADCISRERREGTIGLLFMTPLKARDIVLAKGFVHGLRALSLWLAVIPVLAIPFLLGGLGRREVAMSVLFNFSSICLALAAGLLASAVSKNWLRAQILACILGCGFICAFIEVTGYSFGHSPGFKGSSFSYVGASSLRGGHFAPALAGPSFYYGSQSYQYLTVNRETLPFVGFLNVSDFGGCWGRMLGSLSAAGQSAWLATVGWLAVLSLLFLLGAIELAAFRLRRVWQEEPPSARQLWLEEVLCAPIIGVKLLRWWMARKLERNPIGWLEQRSWSGRLVMWGWFAAMVALYCTCLSGSYGFLIIFRLQILMAWMLLLGLAASAAGSFQRERETGVMELLLVSPVTEGQIIGGRVRGLWGQFLPAMLLLVVVWFYLAHWVNKWALLPDGGADWIQFFCVAFLTLPVIGLYFSLRRKNFMSAFLFTFFIGLLLPLGVEVVLTSGFDALMLNGSIPGEPPDYFNPLRLFVNSAWFVNLLQLLIAFVIARRLYRDLKHRNFAFSRSVT
jgi:ABC-type transport system involved in multi-copper enzyme maturation permease subunit